MTGRWVLLVIDGRGEAHLVSRHRTRWAARWARAHHRRQIRPDLRIRKEII